MASVCRAINTVLEAEGYGEYCHPPHIRRRGHGLGFGSIRPGDVSLDNDTVLTEGMVFMIHPNQHLPETGYLLCGEPVLVTAQRRRTADAAAVRARRDRSLGCVHAGDEPDAAGGTRRLERGQDAEGRVRRARRRALA